MEFLMPVIAQELLVFALSKFNAYTLLKSIGINRKFGMLLPVLIHSYLVPFLRQFISAKFIGYSLEIQPIKFKITVQ
jgi:hypothetical protein